MDVGVTCTKDGDCEQRDVAEEGGGREWCGWDEECGYSAEG